MRFFSAQRGSGLAYGALATALVILLVGALYDVYATYQYRTWGYQAAGEAARMGTLQGTGLDYAAGTVSLDPAAAQGTAEAFLAAALARRGITAYSYDVRVITAPAGGTIAGFPPMPQANLDGGDMRLAGPGVGVYLEFAAPTAWLGLLNRHAYQVHVFSAAQAVEVTP
jgi:hypothetical protein